MTIAISIITATYNCASTVAECVSSVASQRYQMREHIVIDGASTDATLDILSAHRDQLAHLISEPDGGIYHALNKGIARAKGDVIGFLHADDLYANDEVLSLIAQAFEDPTVCAVYGDLQYVARNDTSRVVRHWRSAPFSRARLRWGWMPPHPTLYVRRHWYERMNGFDTRFKIAADYFSILQLFSATDFKATYLPSVLVRMRLGGASNRSLNAVLRKSAEDWRALRETRAGALGGMGALAWKNLSKLMQFY